jgi:hypothetical protein
MVINSDSRSCSFPERGDDEHGSEFQRSECCFLSESGDVVPVGTSDFFNQAMHSKSLKHPRDLGARFVRQEGAKGTILKAMDMKFSTDNPFEQLPIFIAEEIKPAIGPLAIRRRLRDLFKVLDPHGRIVDRGDELQITPVRRLHQFPKHGKAVDGFLQRGIFHFPSAIPMFHLPVVFEKTDVIEGCLNAQKDPQFVIHLNRNRAHMMFNASPFNSGMKIIADLSLIGPMKLSSQEGRHLIGFDSVDGRTDDRFVKGMEIALVFENDIGRKLDLHQRPMVTRWKMPDHWTERFRYLIQPPMEGFDLEAIGELLDFCEILHLYKGILQKTVGEILLADKTGQLVVPVKIELQPKGSPGRDSQIAQSQIFKDEVEIVMDAFRFCPSEKRSAGLFVMPGLERRTGFQGGENMDQPRMISTLGHDLFNSFFLPEVLFPNKFDLQSTLLGQPLGMETDFIPQGLRKTGVIKNPNALGSQMATHRIGVTDIGERASNQNSIEARKDPSNLTGVSFCQHTHGFSLKNSKKDSLYL